MGIAILWLKYKLNYTKARAFCVTVLWGYVEISITYLLYHNILGLSMMIFLYMVLYYSGSIETIVLCVKVK